MLMNSYQPAKPKFGILSGRHIQDPLDEPTHDAFARFGHRKNTPGTSFHRHHAVVCGDHDGDLCGRRR